eukprot:TRINITY_DN13550_c0_g1_i1.p1 TRINITY_DN13550_c0_g1~~TRINITY_DN13550_c0_g1_i1.p1  ORF type:complete len:172 (-),score=11.91 TRINITY_DN13550_c0_g1_i1:45-560(-)
MSVHQQLADACCTGTSEALDCNQATFGEFSSCWRALCSCMDGAQISLLSFPSQGMQQIVVEQCSWFLIMQPIRVSACSVVPSTVLDSCTYMYQEAIAPRGMQKSSRSLSEAPLAQVPSMRSQLSFSEGITSTALVSVWARAKAYYIVKLASPILHALIEVGALSESDNKHV